MNRNEAVLFSVIAICIAIAVTGCEISSNTRFVEIQKIELERDRLGLRK